MLSGKPLFYCGPPRLYIISALGLLPAPLSPLLSENRFIKPAAALADAWLAFEVVVVVIGAAFKDCGVDVLAMRAVFGLASLAILLVSADADA